jgi:hypothetical protein
LCQALLDGKCIGLSFHIINLHKTLTDYRAILATPVSRYISTD